MESTEGNPRKLEHSVTDKKTMNRKVLTRSSSIFLDDPESEHSRENTGNGDKVLEDLKHTDTANNFPDVVNCISTSSQSQESIEDCIGPDIVRSNSSSDEKSIDNQAPSNRAKYTPRSSGTVHTSVSSFSSSDGSRQSTSSNPAPDRKQNTSPVCSFRLDNDDLQQHQAFIAKEDGSTKFLFNQVSVYSPESEDVFDPPNQYRKLQLSDIAPTFINTNSSPSKREGVSNESCSEKGLTARNRFSSSGYCTGSGESAQGNSTSKTSVQLSQERDNTVRSQSTQTCALDIEEIKCVVEDVIGSDLKNQAQTPMYQNQICDNSLVPSGTKMKYDLNPSSQEFKDGPSTSLKPKNIECNQPQGSHRYNLPASTGGSEDKTESQVTAQNVINYQTNISDSATPQPSQAPPQPNFSSTYPMGQQQQQLPASSRGSSTGYADSSQHIWQYFLQQHLLTFSGSLNLNPTQLSSSGSASCFISQSVENNWNPEPTDASLIRLLLLQSGSGPSESSGESRYHLESLIKIDNRVIQTQADVTESAALEVHSVGVQGIPNFEMLNSNSMTSAELPSVMMSSFGDEVGRDIWDKLKKSVRCHEADCDDADCVQIKKDMAALYNERNHVWSLSEAHKTMLLTMFNHMVYFCDHPKCPFPWCGEHEDNCVQLSQEERLKMMKQRMENFAVHCVLSSLPVKYMKLKASLPFDRMPVEGQDWMRLCMMGNSRKTLLVKPMKSGPSGVYSDSEYWVLKKVSTADDGDLWRLYSRLREVNHRSVVTLLWAAGFEEQMLVCSLYEGLSLHDCLALLPPSQFRFVKIFSIMQQLTSAIRHLNNLGIVYLYWISKNILVTYNTGVDFVVKLSNFSFSVLLQRPDGKPPCYDGGHLLLALPRHIIPPELRDNIRVEFVSDMWGLACLLHELVTGCPVWHEHRHVFDKDFKSLKVPCPPNVYPELVDVFTACWQTDTSKRAQLSELEIMLIIAYQTHLMS